MKIAMQKNGMISIHIGVELQKFRDLMITMALLTKKAIFLVPVYGSMLRILAKDWHM